MTHPTDDDQHPALSRHTTDAEIGDAMTKQVALHRASKGGPEPDARQEGWRAGIEAAAMVAREMADLYGPNGSEAAIRQLKKGQDHE